MSIKRSTPTLDINPVLIAELKRAHPHCDTCGQWKYLHSARGKANGFCNLTVRVEDSDHYCAGHTAMGVK